mgnify:CR=1 FL=1
MAATCALPLLREKTRGKEVGVDPSEGMIKKTREKFSGDDIQYLSLIAVKLEN